MGRFRGQAGLHRGGVRVHQRRAHAGRAAALVTPREENDAAIPRATMGRHGACEKRTAMFFFFLSQLAC